MSGMLQGKIAIITGAASGIGRASAALFAREGATVIAADLSPALTETVTTIGEAGGTAIAVTADAGREADVASLVARAVEEFGGLDIFFANAGITGGVAGGFFDATAEIWLETLRVNLIGPFLAVKHAGPEIAERGGGAIICTASVAGLRSGAGPANYSASKAGVINLVQTAAQQLAGTNVRVNAICPGLIETGMTKPAYVAARAAGKEGRIGQINPMLRGGEPAEIASVALFLASPAASYVNGQALAVDGGLSSSLPTVRPAGDRKRAAW
ncbi:MAG TPA: SDR family NAD(P)-dependent oxidoreductase [Acetobacteraceae bacterium]|nr:SDR family NAD(P)-dependent oxidoreductase [Acetobacteraceae bacterium]